MQLYIQSNKAEGLAEKIVEKIKAIKSASVFITRDQRKNDYFHKALSALGFTVHFKSLIEIKRIPIRPFLKPDWVFFSSKNAVKHFFEQRGLIPNPTKEEIGEYPVKIGVVSKATADEVRKYGWRADFIGTSNDTKFIGKKFAALAGSKTVLFPQAKGSLRGIQMQMPKSDNVIDLIVYETIKHKLDIDSSKFEVLVFTSPSNVEAFFEKNKIRKDQRVVAMGDATAATLKKSGTRANKMPITFDDLGLVQAVLGT